MIVVGHTRYKAALKLGLKQVPVHTATDLTPAQIKAYRIADTLDKATFHHELSDHADALGGRLVTVLEHPAADADPPWTGPIGTISRQLLQDTLDNEHLHHGKFILCGPAGMAVERFLISVLCHREALYRIEQPQGDARRGLPAPRHLARSLAFTLTDREPDAVLWQAVAEGKLTTSEDVRKQVERILNVPITVNAMLPNEPHPADPTRRRGIFLHSLTILGPTMPESYEILFAESEKLEGDAKTRFVLERFATRAYRRPVTKEELERLMRLVQQAEKISHYRLSPESFKKLQAARFPGDVAGRLKAMEKAPFTDEDRFVKSVQQRLKGDEFKNHLPTILDAAEKSPQPWEARIGLAVRAVLCSPSFLYRVELDSRPTQKDAHPIDDYQLASRLSYFLWSTMPDQELFDLAAKQQLHPNLPAQVKRMLADPRSKALFDSFAMQWLGLRRLQEFTPDPKLMPDFSRIRARGNWVSVRPSTSVAASAVLSCWCDEKQSTSQNVSSMAAAL